MIAWLAVDAIRQPDARVRYEIAAGDVPAAGVRVTAGEVVATTDARGQVTLDTDAVGTVPVVFEQAGYYPIQATLPPAGSGATTLQLQSSTVTGLISDSATGNALPGVSVSIAGTDVVTVTGADGRYTLANVPADATLAFSLDGYGVTEEGVAARNSVDAALTYSRVTGSVLDAAGEPVANARVVAAGEIGITRNDGTFLIDGVTDVTEVAVSASGFRDATVPVDRGQAAPIRLERMLIRAAYLNQFGLTDERLLDNMIDIINTTELNALVIDIKQDTIYYDSQVQFFRDVPGMVLDLYDPAPLIERLHAEGIYVIARLVVFQDPLVADHYPEYAVKDERDGSSWRNADGVAWVNAFNEPLWDANIELALEAIALGFDEIQYDYVRFPSDGDLSVADFGLDYSQEAREGAITGFIARSSEAIRPTGAKLAIDAFGIIGLWDDDQGIGQRLVQLAPLVDYLCLMIYPSHYELGNIRSAPGHPNDYPGETITESLERAAELVPEHVDKFRPWLQDFTQPLPGFAEYGAEELREQIDAAEAFGGNGWLLWNPNNEPTVEALKPED
ncbi:MAG TPA: putative glycoside hydrolase [Thermomicrobiales bacterium]|jgi:hypothetical protein|nr:putative glycoside hydrolase [Thermomicrobiales bacterium]